MRLTLRRTVSVAVAAQLALEALTWSWAVSHGSWTRLAILAMFTRGALSAGVAIVAVGVGRRWSAPLPSLAVVFWAVVLWAAAGVLSGQFIVHDFGPAAMLGWIAMAFAVAGASAVVGAVVALTYIRRRGFGRAAG